MTIIVTGAYGFIGTNLVHYLNKMGEKNILAVDDLSENVQKFKNLNKAEIYDYIDKDTFLELITIDELNTPSPVKAIFHQGACSDTMNYDGAFMMHNNYEYTKCLFRYAQENKIPFIYASSAATYGDSNHFKELNENENPLNIYGYSKLLFDRYLAQEIAAQNLTAPVFGLRYFNVYGPYETHKGRMASVAFHHFNQFKESGKVQLFGAYDGIEAGEQKRDFVYVDDVVAINYLLMRWAMDKPSVAIPYSGYLNVGTGRAQSFNELAIASINAQEAIEQEQEQEQRIALEYMGLQACIDSESLEYIDFPDALKGKYQSFTQADISKLTTILQECQAGNFKFKSVEEGVPKYIKWLHQNLK